MPHSPARVRYPCPGCGRLTALMVTGGLWVHDRPALNERGRELCPGTYALPTPTTAALSTEAEL